MRHNLIILQLNNIQPYEPHLTFLQEPTVGHISAVHYTVVCCVQSVLPPVLFLLRTGMPPLLRSELITLETKAPNSTE